MTKYNDLEFPAAEVRTNLDRITNQIYKLLPMREEGKEWKATLKNLIVEIIGLNEIFIDQTTLLTLLSKMEGLVKLDRKCDFIQFRKTIFDCLGELTKMKNEWVR